MNPIPQRQNDFKQLQRLAAQRQLYADAKRVFAAQVVLSAPVAIIWSAAVVWFPSVKSIAALWGLCVSLADLFWLTPWQKRLRERAARVQECFDCDVLEIPWNDIKVGKRPDPEVIKEYGDVYARSEPKLESLQNWYPVAVGKVDLDIARIICQRANCWWDAKQRKKYASWIITVVLSSTAITFAIGILGKFTVDELFLAVVAPLAPTLILGARQFTEQLEAATRLDHLKEHAERLWGLAFTHPKDCELLVKSRTLQDEIFENRKRSPLVFDWIFKKLRDRFEVQMNHGADDLVADALQRLASSEKVGAPRETSGES